jgi:hypothetical protein
MRRNVKIDDLAEREFTRESRDISWFDEGKETLTRRVRQIQTGRRGCDRTTAASDKNR